jgi:MSHA biogenesis protein MshJ
MKPFDIAIAKFAGLELREQLLVTGALAISLYFLVDLSLLGPQQKRIERLRQQDQAHKTELVTIQKALAETEEPAKGIASPANDHAVLAALKKQIADAEAIYAQLDGSASQVGALVAELLEASPGLTLVSLKTLPVAPFLGAENKPGGEANTIIYKHGVEVRVKGNYLTLLSYMENLQKHPHPLFWAEAGLDASAPPDAMLKLVIYSLSRQSSTPLR